MPTRVVLTKPYQGKAYKIGDAVILPDHVAAIKLSDGSARPFGAADAAAEEKAREKAVAERKEAEKAEKAEAKEFAVEVSAEREKLDAADDELSGRVKVKGKKGKGKKD